MKRRTVDAKGFATIFGLCLILVVALVVKGIQAAETNHGYETADFQAEFELQNAADSAIVAALDKVLLAKENGVELLHDNSNYEYGYNRQKVQVKLLQEPPRESAHLENFTVEVYGERINVHPHKVSYGAEGEDSDSSTKNKAKPLKPDRVIPSYFFFSIAQATNKHTGGKIYHRATAYVEVNDTATIHFMEQKMSSYTFQ